MPSKANLTARLDDYIDKYYKPDEPRPALLTKLISDVMELIENEYR